MSNDIVSKIGLIKYSSYVENRISFWINVDDDKYIKRNRVMGIYFVAC